MDTGGKTEMQNIGCGYQIAGLTPSEEPSGRWYHLDECELEEGGTYSVKVSVTAASKKAGMAGARAKGVQTKFIRKTPRNGEENNTKKSNVDDEENADTNDNNVRNASNKRSVDGLDLVEGDEQKLKNGAGESGKELIRKEENGSEEDKSTLVGAGTGIMPDNAESNEEYDTFEDQSQDVSTVSSGRNGTTATTRVRIPSRKSSTQNAYLETPLETPLEGKKIDWSSGVDKDADYKNMSKDDLIKRILVMEKQIKEANSTISSWEKGVRQILNCIILSPMMNHFYRQKLTTTLENVFLGVSSISNVVYINCSFPSIEAEFPNVKLQTWSGLERSKWKVKWKPSWHITARVEGSHYLSFTLNILIRKLCVKGEFNLECAKDLTTVTIWFEKLPTIDLQIQTTIVLGILPIPLSIMQETLASKIRTAFIGWLQNNLVYPNSLQFPCLRGYTGLNEEAILEEAKAAAKIAQRSLRA